MRLQCEALRREACGLSSKSNPRFAQIVGRHLNVDPVSNTDPDKVFSHFARDVGEDFVPVGKGNSKHGARKHLSNRAVKLDGFFFCCHIVFFAWSSGLPAATRQPGPKSREIAFKPC
jgi:hypothetical protein